MNFHDQALEFVRQNNCAVNTPVELIEKAMERGAEIVVMDCIDKVRTAKLELESKRERNLRG